VVLVSSGYIVITAIFIILFLQPYPENVGIDIDSGNKRLSSVGEIPIELARDPETDAKEGAEESQNDFNYVRNIDSDVDISRGAEPTKAPGTEKKGVSFWAALKLPG
jgi:hypothetical protein